MQTSFSQAICVISILVLLFVSVHSRSIPPQEKEVHRSVQNVLVSAHQVNSSAGKVFEIMCQQRNHRVPGDMNCTRFAEREIWRSHSFWNVLDRPSFDSDLLNQRLPFRLPRLSNISSADSIFGDDINSHTKSAMLIMKSSLKHFANVLEELKRVEIDFYCSSNFNKEREMCIQTAHEDDWLVRNIGRLTALVWNACKDIDESLTMIWPMSRPQDTESQVNDTTTAISDDGDRLRFGFATVRFLKQEAEKFIDILNEIRVKYDQIIS